MPSSSPIPYNVTISNDSPTITYWPYRDGPMSNGWNLTCADSVDSTWVLHGLCEGPSSQRSTYIGASLQIQFEGTAAYLYGIGDPGSYVVQLDGDVKSSPSANLSAGLLDKSEGLDFGQHTLFLNVTQPTLVSFSEVILTVGLGMGGSTGPNVNNRTLHPFTIGDKVTTLNPVFDYTGSWEAFSSGVVGNNSDSQIIYPRQRTMQTNAYVTFNLNQTSAFFIYGLVDSLFGEFSVTVTPPPDLGPPVTNVYNTSAHWAGADRVMYWTSGMDRDSEYSVKITNLGSGQAPWWAFSHIDIIDAGSSPGKHRISAGVIAAAAIGASVALLLLLAGLLYYNRKIKPLKPVKNTVTGFPLDGQALHYGFSSTARNIPDSRHKSSQHRSMSTLSEPTAYNYRWSEKRREEPQVVREEDAGTLSFPGENVVRLPPDYDQAWSRGVP